jgi:hypothetical protein
MVAPQSSYSVKQLLIPIAFKIQVAAVGHRVQGSRFNGSLSGCWSLAAGNWRSLIDQWVLASGLKRVASGRKNEMLNPEPWNLGTLNLVTNTILRDACKRNPKIEGDGGIQTC